MVCWRTRFRNESLYFVEIRTWTCYVEPSLTKWLSERSQSLLITQPFKFQHITMYFTYCIHFMLMFQSSVLRFCHIWICLLRWSLLRVEFEAIRR